MAIYFLLKSIIMMTHLRTFLSILAALLTGMTFLSATEGKTILVLVTGAEKMTNGKPTGLWLEEFAVPYKVFVDAGYEVAVMTPNGGAAPIDPRSFPDPDQKAAWNEATQRLLETQKLEAVTPDDFVAIFIPGGHGVMFDLANNAAAANLIEEFDAQGKPIAAVCHGPAAFVDVMRKDGTPLLKGRRVTAFSDEEERAVKLDKDMPFLLETKLRELGAVVDTREKFTAHAVRDGNLITGQNPASSEETAQLLLNALSENKK